MKSTAAVLMLTFLCLFPISLSADSPNLLNYQGRLTDAGGNPRNGTFSMVFSIWDAVTAGNQLPGGSPWLETQSVSVTNGVFNVLLGSEVSLPANLFDGGPSDSAGALRFLQISVAGETLSPRRRIVSAAYALSGGLPGYLQCKRFDTATTQLSGYQCTCGACGTRTATTHYLRDLPLSWMSYYCATNEPGTVAYYDTVAFAAHDQISTHESLPLRLVGCTDYWTGVAATLWCCK